MSKLFIDSYVHLGGDEVVFGCWFNDPRIAAWAASQGFRTGPQIEEVTSFFKIITGLRADILQYFESRLQKIVLPGGNGRINKKMVVWEELFENGIKLLGT